MYSEKSKEKKTHHSNDIAVRNTARRQKYRKQLGASISNETEGFQEKFQDTKQFSALHALTINSAHIQEHYSIDYKQKPQYMYMRDLTL